MEVDFYLADLHLVGKLAVVEVDSFDPVLVLELALEPELVFVSAFDIAVAAGHTTVAAVEYKFVVAVYN